MENNENTKEIDIMQILRALWKKAWLIILIALFVAGCTFTWTYFFVTPLYKSSILIYVNNISSQDSSKIVTQSELAAAQRLVDTYLVILRSRTTLDDVSSVAEVDYTSEELSSMITAGAVNSTEIFSVTVTSSDPAEAVKIANVIGEVLPKKISETVNGSDVRIVDSAIEPTKRSSPSYSKNTIIGFLIGAVLCAAVVIIKDITDNVIRTDEYLMTKYDLPILASIPYMSENDNKKKSGYYQEKKTAATGEGK